VTGYVALLVVLLAGFIVLSAVGGWVKSEALIGFGLAVLGVYLLCQLVHSL
jgi:hypothetical protein